MLCDSSGANPQTKPESLIYRPEAAGDANDGSSAAKGFVTRWSERVSSAGEAKVTLRDFDLLKPERPLSAASSDSKQHPNDSREVYNYPGNFVDESRGTTLGKTMLEAMRSERQLYNGESLETSLFCGGKFTLKEHPADRLNVAYLITHTYHTVVAETYRSGAMADRQPYHVRFEAIPASVPFRLHRRPRARASRGWRRRSSAVPDGEDIWTDDYGRVMVRFPWDRSDTTGDKCTCFIRVAQFGNLGSVILPRVGQEVMVDFLGGDPDRPIVCGWVFNKSLKPIYPLPDNKTRSLWRTKRYGDAGHLCRTSRISTSRNRAPTSCASRTRAATRKSISTPSAT